MSKKPGKNPVRNNKHGRDLQQRLARVSDDPLASITNARFTITIPRHGKSAVLIGRNALQAVVNAKRAENEEAIRETVALTTRELSNEEQRIMTSSTGIRAQDETSYVKEDVWLTALISRAPLNSYYHSAWRPSSITSSIALSGIYPLFALSKDWSTTTQRNTPPSKELDKLLYRKRWWYDAGVMAG
ncbi:hypothetical protein BDM02DRAFT_3131574 [Thelephora ganbajun]|uniref:Uncharacterized protein n=1 Tax=Thelephora ganbajun TaxID=370292 RepID=A0ACB6Z5Y2_THEGA|nr:hypothetical protein BDM02DRAFT_3131574 [Thelephora ganbajun]